MINLYALSCTLHYTTFLTDCVSLHANYAKYFNRNDFGLELGSHLESALNLASALNKFIELGTMIEGLGSH